MASVGGVKTAERMVDLLVDHGRNRAHESKGPGADDYFLYCHPEEPIIKKKRTAGKGSMNDDKDSLLPTSSSSCSSSTGADEE